VRLTLIFDCYQTITLNSIIMNKTELIDAMAADAGITKAAAKKALESFLGNVGGSLKSGKRVSLVGFGSWSVSKRSAREGRNPQTGATIQIAAKNVVKFKAGAELSGAVN
jgi:DNA-binding protein HU-beta